MIKTIDEIIKLCEDDFCGKSIRDILKEWGDSIVDQCCKDANVIHTQYRHGGQWTQVDKDGILKVKEQIK